MTRSNGQSAIASSYELPILMNKTLASLLHEYCAARPEWNVCYTDVNPNGHCVDLESLRQLDASDQHRHPLFKTRLCTKHSSGEACPRGDSCPCAHGSGELRLPPSDLPAPTYQLAISLKRPDEHPLEFCNLDSHPQKSEAKADCAAQVIRALGLKAIDGRALVDDDSWSTAGPRVSRQLPREAALTPSNHRPASIPPWQKRQLLEVVCRLSQAEAVQLAGQHGYEPWVSCIGGTFGSLHPRLAKVMRDQYGSFKEFVTTHAGQIPHPRQPIHPAQPQHPAQQPQPPQHQELSSFYDALITWICARDAESHCVSAAHIGQFYMDHPVYEVFRGKWKPGRHCERDGRLQWTPDESAPGMGWISVPGDQMQEDVNAFASQVVAQLGAAESAAEVESRDANDDDISWLVRGKELSVDPLPDKTRAQALPHPAILAIVRAAGRAGVEMRALRMQLELGLRLSRTVKTHRLDLYVGAFPAALRVTESNTEIDTDPSGHPLRRVHAVELEGESLGAWSHASRFTRPDNATTTTACSLDATYEFLDAQGIDLQTLSLMTAAELVGLGLSPDTASRVLSDSRPEGKQPEYDGDVYADYDEYDEELKNQNVALEQQNLELLQRCSDLQLRVSVLEEARMCCICMERKRNTVIMPCMHAMFCSLCLHGVKLSTTCPTCRGPIRGVIECRFDMVDEEQVG